MSNSNQSADPRNSVAYEIRGAFRAFENALIKYLAEKKVPVAYFHLLRLPWEEHGFSQKDIAKLAFMTPSVTSQLVKNMAGDGLLLRKRISSSNTANQIYLTQKGQQLRDDVLGGALDIPKTACEHLSDAETANLINTLKMIRTNL